MSTALAAVPRSDPGTSGYSQVRGGADWRHDRARGGLQAGSAKPAREQAPQPQGAQSSSGAQSCPTPCETMDCSMPDFPVYHQLPEFTQTQVHPVGDAIQPSHPLSSPSPPALNLSQHQGLFQCSSHWVAKVLEFQLQHQSFQ